MTFLNDRQGNLSLFRVSVLVAIVGGLLVGAGALTFFLDQESYRTPLDIDLPPGAEQWGEPQLRRPGLQESFYRVPGGDIQSVVAHYNQRLIDHYGVPDDGTRPQECDRFPRGGFFPDYDPESGDVPFYYRCSFDRAGLSALQYTEVTIQPGVFNEDPFLNSEGDVVIVYEQTWEP